MRRRIAVGMSGGVDSSVAALLLKEAGHEVVGVTMATWPGDAAGGAGATAGGPAGAAAPPRPAYDSCYGPGEERDIEDAARVCARLGIPHRVIDLKDAYRELVLDHARAEYLAGRTPNPCVRCNQLVKFGLLFDRLAAAEGGFDAFATGHYARVERDPASGRWCVRAAADAAKDQSYFLCRLGQEQLAHIFFPLGDLAKTEVRARARAAGLDVHDRPESQDFAAGGYRAAVDLPDREGAVTDATGAVIGTHRGHWGYTVGQRRGLGVGGVGPLYVTRIDAARNVVVAGPDADLWRRELAAADVNWMAVPRLEGPARFAVKIRYRNAAAPAAAESAGAGRVRIAFDEPQRAITPGQAAVAYDDGGRIAFAGTIEG